MTNHQKKNKQRVEFDKIAWEWMNNSNKTCVMFDAGELGLCICEWSTRGGGQWEARWFDKAEIIPVGGSETVA